MRHTLRGLVLGVLLLAGPAAVAAGKVNVNSAGASELASVPGIDARLAARIIAYRAASGPFEKPADLTRVPGFSKVTLVKVIDHIELGPTGEESSGSVTRRVDLNEARFPELLLIPKMTAGMAKAIVDYRKSNGPYRSVRDLGKVPGLDRKRLSAVAKHVYVDPSLQRTPTPRPTPKPTPTQVVRRTTPVRRSTPRPTPQPTPRPTTRTESPTATPEPATAILPDGRVDLNRATLEDLMTLPRMTRAAAKEVVAWRDANGSFQRTDDLLRVPLFGQAAYARLKDQIAVSEE